MTLNEMLTAVQTDNVSDELIDALTEFYWDFDPYGIMEEYGGHISDKGVRKAVADNVRYLLRNDKDTLLSDLRGN